MEYSTDSPHTRSWVERIGKFVVNFSALEMECAHWLVQLSEQHKDIKKFMDLNFSTKAKLLGGHIETRSINHRWRKESFRAWSKATELSKVRNLVSHNPVMFFWNNPTETGDPDFVGVPNPRGIKLPNKESRLSTASADRAIDDMVVLVKKLAALRQEWCEIRDNGGAPPPRLNQPRKSLVSRIREFIKKYSGSKRVNSNSYAQHTIATATAGQPKTGVSKLLDTT
jgi:hypothetical protein